MRRLLRPLWTLLALVFLAEAWLWSHLQPLVAWIVDRIAWQALRARLAAAIEGLPPAATLVVFIIPVLLLLPLKLAGLWLLAHGSWLGAAAVLALAKVVGMGVSAFLFDLTRPKLLQLAWFRWLYERVMAGLAWAHRQIDPVKLRVRAWLHATVTPVMRRLRARLRLLRRQPRGRFFRHIVRIRRRVRGQPASF